MSRNSSIHLPTELIELILDNLHQDPDIVALKACSLVNQVFRVLSQSRLLQAISFRTNESGGNDAYYSVVSHLIEDMKHFSQIPSYVQRLVLPCKWISGQGLQSSIAEIDRFSGLFVSLRNLLELCIPDPCRIGRRDAKGLYNWIHDVSYVIQSALPTLFNCSTKLTSLDLTGIEILPGDLLNRCSALKRLSVAVIVPPIISSHYSVPYTARPIQLEYFRMTYTCHSPPSLAPSTSILGWLNSPSCSFDFQHLKVLKITFIGMEKPDSDRLFNFCPLVHHIMIDATGAPIYTLYNSEGGNRAYHPGSLIDLKGFKALRHLTIEGVIFSHHRTLVDYYETPLPWITDMIDSITTSSLSANKLSEVTLRLAFIGYPMAFTHYFHNNLVALAASLGTGSLPSFSKLNLHITGLTPWELTLLKEDEALVEMEKEGRLAYV